MLTHVAEERPVGDVTVAARGDSWGPAALQLSHRIGDADEIIVDLDGELDIASAEQAVSYVRDVIDHRRGPVIVNLAALAFCDARGLAALVRMARYAEQSNCPLQVASPSPSLVKIMRITGLNRRFLASQAPAQPIDSTAQRAESAFGAHPALDNDAGCHSYGQPDMRASA